MSAYRSELEAARRRLVALEDLLADQGAQRARVARAGGERSPWWRRTSLLGAGALGAVLSLALCSATPREATVQALAASPDSRARELDWGRTTRAMARAVDHFFGALASAPTARAEAASAPSSSPRPTYCLPKHSYRTLAELPEGSASLELSDESGNRSQRAATLALLTAAERRSGDLTEDLMRAPDGWQFGKRVRIEPSGPSFPVSAALGYALGAPDLQPLHFDGGRLLSLRESHLVLFELDRHVQMFAVYFRQGGSRLPETRRVTLVGHDGNDDLVDATVLEYETAADPPTGVPESEGRHLIAVEACRGASLTRARLDIGTRGARLYSVLVYPPPPGKVPPAQAPSKLEVGGH